ncbi:MAG: HMA2 domain-containing protein [Nitrospirota bacterium]
MTDYYIHNVPGRLRLKSPAFKRNRNVIDELKKALSTISGIGTVDVNPTTGSLLINYNPKAVQHQEIIGLLQRKGYFDSAKAATNDQYIHSAVTRAGNLVTRVVFGSVVEKTFEGSALSLLTYLI